MSDLLSDVHSPPFDKFFLGMGSMGSCSIGCLARHLSSSGVLQSYDAPSPAPTSQTPATGRLHACFNWPQRRVSAIDHPHLALFSLEEDIQLLMCHAMQDLLHYLSVNPAEEPPNSCRCLAAPAGSTNASANGPSMAMSPGSGSGSGNASPPDSFYSSGSSGSGGTSQNTNGAAAPSGSSSGSSGGSGGAASGNTPSGGVVSSPLSIMCCSI